LGSEILLNHPSVVVAAFLRLSTKIALTHRQECAAIQPLAQTTKKTPIQKDLDGIVISVEAFDMFVLHGVCMYSILLFSFGGFWR
jgi:hypothetical protein